MLINVLTRFASDAGFDPVQQRSACINILNDSAKELYNLLECNKIYREVTLAVPPDSVVALPSFIGELKGMRMHTNEIPFELHSLSTPRYVSNTFQFRYKNWRDLGDSPINTKPSGVGKLKITVPFVETTPVELLISGQTNVASRIEETVLIDQTEVFTSNMFTQNIEKIVCLSSRTADITIKDINDNELAVLRNIEQKTRYKLVDVSQVFWTLDTADGNSLIDVVYKIPLSRLLNDSDSFPAGEDYDNAWYYMAMNVWLSNLQGRGDEAAQARQSAIIACHAAKEGSEGEIIKKVYYGRNKFYGLFRRYRYFPGSITNVDLNIRPV